MIRISQYFRSYAVIALVLVLSFSNVPFAKASNNGECDFGYKYIEGEYNVDLDEWDSSCEQALWEYEIVNDGFTKRITLSMDEDLYGLPGGTTILDLTLIARCEAKKLEVFFASKYVIFNNQNRSYSRLFQYRIDNGKIITTTFSESTSDKALFISSPKTLLTNMLKAKNKINIKFSTSKGSQVSQFPIADFVKYRSKFASAGCKF
jgi:hypothetical protein